MDFQELKLNLQDLLNRVNEIRDNVFKIETKENIVDHILVHDKKINCDIVVGGADYHHIENHLMDKKNRNKCF